MRSLLTVLCLLVMNRAQAQEYTPALMAAKMDLDSAWARTIAPSSDKICLPEQSNLLRKKLLSDHQCIENAIAAARTQGADAAMPWLIASQCYNPAAQDRVAKAGTDAVRYVMNTWGGGQAGIVGAPTAVEVTEPVMLNLSFMNQTGDWMYVYEVMTNAPEGKRPCEEYLYVTKVAVNRPYLRKIGKGQYAWIRFSDKKANNGCGEFLKEFKVGPTSDQATSRSEVINIQ